MRYTLAGVLIASASLLLACSDDTGKRDADPDQRLAGDQGPPPAALTCKPDRSDCRDFVISRLLLPLNAGDADRYGLKLPGSGSINALGGILAALSSLGSTAVQDTVDDVVYHGSTIVLARLQAESFVAAGSLKGQTWVGAKTSCCPSAGEDRLRCKEEALKSCFSGEPPHEFAVEASAVQSSLLDGNLTSGAVSLTTARLRINLPLTSAGVMELTLRSVQLRGRIDGDRLREGTLAGTITRSEVDQKLIPAVAQMLDLMIKDPTTEASMKDFLATVFDRNKDNAITQQEVTESSIKSLLAGDVDTDKDGEKELSLGIGFEGVRAIIQGK